MMFRQFVKGGIDHFNVRPCHRLLHVRYLLRTFIDQENDQMQVRIIFSLPTWPLLLIRLSYQPSAGTRSYLSVLSPMGLNKSMTRIATGQPKRSIFQSAVRKDRRHIFKVASSGCFLCGIAIDGLDIKQGGEFFILRPHSGYFPLKYRLSAN